MGKLTIIKNVKGYIKDETVFLNLEDVARGLGWTRDNGKYIRWERIEPHFSRFNTVPLVGQRPKYIEEGDFYMLAMIADSEVARAFQKLVCYEILPSIRKNGMYAKDELLDNPDLLIKIATKLKEEREIRKQLEADNLIKNQQISELKPKASYYDLILQCKDLLSVTMIAKDYGMSAKKFNELLHRLGIQFRQSGIWFIYQKYADKGYTQTKVSSYNKTDGTQGAKPHTYWTQKGRVFLYDILKENNYLPTIEKFK